MTNFTVFVECTLSAANDDFSNFGPNVIVHESLVPRLQDRLVQLEEALLEAAKEQGVSITSDIPAAVLEDMGFIVGEAHFIRHLAPGGDDFPLVTLGIVRTHEEAAFGPDTPDAQVRFILHTLAQAFLPACDALGIEPFDERLPYLEVGDIARIQGASL